MALGNDERATMGRAVRQSEGRGRDIHLAIAHQNIAIAAEPTEAPVLVNIDVVGVEEAAVTQHKIEDWIPVAVRLQGISPKHVVDLPPVMLTARNLRIAVVV